MNESALPSRHAYGNVSASGSTRVILGDNESNNIRIESATINLSCQCTSDFAANLSSMLRWDNRASTSTLDYGTKPDWVQQNTRDHVYRDHSDPRAKLLAKPETTNNDYAEAMLSQSALGNTVATPTIKRQRRSRTEASIDRLDVEAGQVSKVYRPVSKIVIRSEPSAYGDRKIASSHSNFKCNPGYDHYRPPVSASRNSARENEINITFTDDLAKSNKLTRQDNHHRIFFLQREISDWTQSTCSESFMPITQITKRVKHGPNMSRTKAQNIERTLERLEPRRRYISKYVLQEVNRSEPESKWSIVAIDNENPKFTRRTGEVDVFSVILAKESDIVSPE